MDVTADDGVLIGNTPHEQLVRQEIMRLLRGLPGLAYTIRHALAQGGFRVVMSTENAQLFKQAADGFYKPYLHNGKEFVENVNLAKMGPDYSGLVTDLAGQIQIAAIMAKLDRVEQTVERMQNDQLKAKREIVAGWMSVLEINSKLRDPQERRTQMLSACSNAVANLKVLAGQLKSDIKVMPLPKRGWWEDPSGDRLEDARKAFAAVSADMAVIAAGCRATLDAFMGLNELEAARAAFASFLRDVEAAGLNDAAHKARLVPYVKGKSAPEMVPRWFAEAVGDLDARFLLPRPDAKPFSIHMDLRTEDLEDQP